MNHIKGIQAYGPISAPFEKLGGNYRIHIILKCQPKLMESSKIKFFQAIDKDLVESKTMGVRVSIDIDPINLL